MKHATAQHLRGKGHKLTVIVLTAIFSAIAVKWAWSSVGVKLFSLPEASFMEIASLITAFIAFLAIIGAVRSRGN